MGRGFGEVQPSCPGLSCIIIQPLDLMPMVSFKEVRVETRRHTVHPRRGSCKYSEA